jgi:N-ethylmaleimide reductase
MGRFALAHRVVLPAMTRLRAIPPGIPSSLMARYYEQRASPGGLMVCEAAAVSPGGSVGTSPGLFTAEQVNNWRAVTDAVHAQGGIVLAQLGHGCTLVRSVGWVAAPDGAEIDDVIGDYRNAAENAGDAGFDGVELQVCDGALAERLLRGESGIGATTAYQGSLHARVRFLREATQALAAVWGTDRVGVALAPDLPPMHLPHREETEAAYALGVAELARLEIAYLNLGRPWSTTRTRMDGEDLALQRFVRQQFKGTLIVAGGYTVGRAEAALQCGAADAVAFGRAFIANPDLPYRLRNGLALAHADAGSFFRGGARGYTDYPASTGA